MFVCVCGIWASSLQYSNEARSNKKFELCCWNLWNVWKSEGWMELMCHRIFVLLLSIWARARISIFFGIFENMVLVFLSTEYGYAKKSSVQRFGIYLHWVKVIWNLRIIDYFMLSAFVLVIDSIWISNESVWLFLSIDFGVKGVACNENEQKKVTCGEYDNTLQRIYCVNE